MFSDMAYMQISAALMQQQMQQYFTSQAVITQQHQQLQAMFPNPFLGLAGSSSSSLAQHQKVPAAPSGMTATFSASTGEASCLSAAGGGALGGHPGLPPANDPESVRQAVAAFAAGMDTVLPGMVIRAWR